MRTPRDDKRPGTWSEAHKASAELGERIARAQAKRPAEAEANQGRQGDMTGLSRGLRLASEFVAAIFVGAGLGYLLDMFLPTRPWGLVVLMLLGFCAGVLNVVRTTAQINAETPVAPSAPDDPDDDDD